MDIKIYFNLISQKFKQNYKNKRSLFDWKIQKLFELHNNKMDSFLLLNKIWIRNIYVNGTKVKVNIFSDNLSMNEKCALWNFFYKYIYKLSNLILCILLSIGNMFELIFFSLHFVNSFCLCFVVN